MEEEEDDEDDGAEGHPTKERGFHLHHKVSNFLLAIEFKFDISVFESHNHFQAYVWFWNSTLPRLFEIYGHPFE